MNVSERDLVRTAHGGDEDAFRHLVELRRPALLAHCRRMLGSRLEAEDALQDTLFHAWRGLSAYHGRGALRRWLYRIATNVCLDAIAERPKRGLPIDDGGRDGAREDLPRCARGVEPPPDQLAAEDGYSVLDARYEQREAVEHAFVMALRLLPPRQRVVLVLRDVLGFSAKEVARSLAITASR